LHVAESAAFDATAPRVVAQDDCDCDDCPADEEGQCEDDCTMCSCCSSPTTLSTITIALQLMASPAELVEDEMPEIECRPTSGVPPGVFKPPRHISRI
jgi:hypothetical protein